MAILKRTGAVLVMGAATAAVIGMSSAPAFSATTFTVKPGGSITAKASKPTLKDTKTGTVLTCVSSSGKGSVKSGSGLSGNGIGSITSLGFTTCTGPLGLTFTVKTTGFPWKLNAASSSGGVTKGTITGIKATLTGPGCSATIAGATATAAATVDVSYSNTTGKLSTAGGNLHIYNVSGCAGLIHSGDPSTFTGAYAISPKQTITSP